LGQFALQQIVQVSETGVTWPGSLAGWEVPLTTLIRAVFVVLITLILASRVRHWFERATLGTRADPNTRLLVARILALLVLVIGAATVLDTIGIPLSAVVTFVGVVGLAISLALQDILKNFFAGLYLLFERPFRLGDVVVVKDQTGVVETIGIRTTTLRTEDNVQVLIPNITIFVEIVLNRSDLKPKTSERADPEDSARAPTSRRPGGDAADVAPRDGPQTGQRARAKDPAG
jgi:small-conductance mechanosensitive channel